MGSILMQMTHCPSRVCPDQARHTPFLASVGHFVVWAADALAVSLPWHLLWLAPSVGCLYGGVVLRRRSLRRAAA